MFCLMAFIANGRQFHDRAQRVLAAVTTSQKRRVNTTEMSFGV